MPVADGVCEPPLGVHFQVVLLQFAAAPVLLLPPDDEAQPEAGVRILIVLQEQIGSLNKVYDSSR